MKVRYTGSQFYGYTKDQLGKFFDSIILSLLLYEQEVWGSAFLGKYLDRIDKFFERALRFGYTPKNITISDVILKRDRTFFNIIISNTEHALYD